MCMMALGPILGLVGSIVSAGATMAAADNQAAAQEAQAAAYERQALIERTTAQYEADRQREQGAKLAGRQRAAYLSAGVSLMGTPSDIIAESTQQNEMDVAAIKYNHEVKAGNFETQAAIYRMTAEGTRSAGQLSALAPVIGGLGKAFGGSSSSSFGGSIFSGADA